MEAPDKIYTDNRGVYAELPIFSQADANVEYIRKDALLEWAKEQLDILNKQTLLHPDDEVFWGQRNAFKQLIDKLNSM